MLKRNQAGLRGAAPYLGEALTLRAARVAPPGNRVLAGLSVSIYNITATYELRVKSK